MPDSILMLVAIFVAALGGLMKSADVLVDGSTSIARRLNVSDMVIGLTVVALGTSLPELVVSVSAAAKGLGALAAANVIGSNLANIALVVGATAIIFPISTPKSLRRIDIFILALVTLALPVTIFISGTTTYPSILGYSLMAALVYFIYSVKNAPNSELDAGSNERSEPMMKAVLMTVVGLILLLVSGHFTVESAIEIARIFEVSEATIGVTIVAIGTSLPELVASIVAAKKGAPDLAIGNVIGSNIMNISLVLGAALLINPIEISNATVSDGFAMTAVTAIFVMLILRKRTPQIPKSAGYLFLGFYLSYLCFVAVR
jgi:cation:H+ antiporter